MKKILTAAMLGLALISAGCGSDDPKPGTDTAVTAEVNSTEGQIQKAIADTINKSSLSTGPIALDKIEINKLGDGYNVNVWAKLDSKQSWSGSTAISAIRLYAIPVYAGAYTSGQSITRVSFIVQGDLSDGKGNTHLSKVFQSELTAQDAKSYNWENADSIDPDKLGKNIFIHPAFRNK